MIIKLMVIIVLVVILVIAMVIILSTLKLMTMMVMMMVMTKTMCGIGENSVDAAAYSGDDDSHARLSLSVIASAYVYQRHVRVDFSHILLMLLD